MAKSRRVSRRKSRSRSVSAGRRKCNSILSRKVGKNLKELKSGRYVSRKQAIAVSYSQVRKSHPKCRRYFNRK